MPDLTCNDLQFHVAVRGTGRPVILLHGFTGSVESWSAIGDRLASSRRVVAIDLIGHGASAAPEDPRRYAFDRALDDLAAIASHTGIARAAWLGYSMGGRLALALAIRHPDLASALVLESASPGIADPIARAGRRQADEALAARIEADGVAAFVAEWERRPMWDSQRSLQPAALAHQRDVRLRNRARGLAGSLRGMGVGVQASYWDRLQTLRVPALLIAGARDTKFAQIATRMQAALPQAELWLAPGAGHAVHLEQPDLFSERVERFLDQIDHDLTR